MSNHSNNEGEMVPVATIASLAAIVGVLILVQLFRAKPVDVPSMLVIAACFVIAVIVTGMWGQRTGKH